MGELRHYKWRQYKLRHTKMQWTEADERVWNQAPYYPGEYTNDQAAWLSRFGHEPQIRGTVGEWVPGKRLRYVMCMDDTSVDFGYMFLQWSLAKGGQ